MIPAGDRRGPAWAWELQDRLDDRVGGLVALLLAVVVGVILAAVAASGYGWVCSWWGVSDVIQARAFGGLVAGVYAAGVAAGMAVSWVD